MSDNNSWTVVVIDDEEDIRDVMAMMLNDSGYHTQTASDGISGVDLCYKILPQIVITDIRMPGMDGLKVLETLKKNIPDIEIIVATAFGEMDIAIRALQLDASDFITKPISHEAFFMALTRAKERFTARKKIKDYTVLLEEEKNQTAEELLKSFAFQKNLIESSMDGILGCDENETVITYNISMELLLGYAKKDVINQMALKDFFIQEELDRFKAELAGEKFGGKHKLYLFETILLDSKGNEVAVQVSATEFSINGKKSGLVCFFRDLSILRRLEREVTDQAGILHQDKMMSLGRLAASVAHEINNPLSGVLNYIRLMHRIMERGQLTEDSRSKFINQLELIESEISRCTQIVSGLLTFSRKSDPSFAKISVEYLLNRCVLLSRHKMELGKIELKLNINPILPEVEGDFNQLQQCVINLIFNAIDAMPDGETLELSAENESVKGFVTISVKDSGLGISEKDLNHIFEPFFTTKKDGYGIGLGLSTVYGIMERHKGSIEAKSRPGKGSVFMLRLPVENKFPERENGFKNKN